MKIRWTPEAEADRSTIWDYLAARDPAAAVRIDSAIDHAVTRLADFPSSGHIGAVAGTREVHPHRNYRLVYAILGNTLWILTIVHAARQWPPITPD
ncbi:type II toxin-antitoxin system RelE/ParE family toxin [Sphingomonas sp. 2R-10]|uniref:type II toxin-antitoxin system RelE/ParE family toxin n=1 Tax=Sphingomonas sp. 2R-10 TaxID=3045148 RepID=UPI000F7A82C6|nr:type II toxin-antitoxin system RelE/ParE family toxin [Sphingomonas sp. 2R-10]MDJ0278228.1 type II toxin-antitoxin system RelE/ParE family toxin [Sphingomonas sp. 2R-10]